MAADEERMVCRSKRFAQNEFGQADDLPEKLG
jgi:hypothetical protein